MTGELRDIWTPKGRGFVRTDQAIRLVPDHGGRWVVFRADGSRVGRYGSLDLARTAGHAAAPLPVTPEWSYGD